MKNGDKLITLRTFIKLCDEQVNTETTESRYFVNKHIPLKDLVLGFDVGGSKRYLFSIDDRTGISSLDTNNMPYHALKDDAGYLSTAGEITNFSAYLWTRVIDRYGDKLLPFTLDEVYEMRNNPDSPKLNKLVSLLLKLVMTVEKSYQSYETSIKAVLKELTNTDPFFAKLKSKSTTNTTSNSGETADSETKHNDTPQMDSEDVDDDYVSSLDKSKSNRVANGHGSSTTENEADTLTFIEKLNALMGNSRIVNILDTWSKMFMSLFIDNMNYDEDEYINDLTLRFN